MSEIRYIRPEPIDQVAKRAAEWLHDPHRTEERAAYQREKVIYTNNLYLRFIPNVPAEVWPGRANPFYYNNKPYSHIIGQIKEENYDLCTEGLTAHSEFIVAQRLTGHSPWAEPGPDTEPDAVHTYELYWKFAKNFDQVFRLIVPRLQAAMIDPLDACV